MYIDMKKLFVLFVVVFFLVTLPCEVFSSGAINRRRQIRRPPPRNYNINVENVTAPPIRADINIEGKRTEKNEVEPPKEIVEEKVYEVKDIIQIF